jgi:hypothetical protein
MISKSKYLKYTFLVRPRSTTDCVFGVNTIYYLVNELKRKVLGFRNLKSLRNT